MTKFTTQEMIEKISVMSDVRINASYRKGFSLATASIIDTSVHDDEDKSMKLYSHQEPTIDDAVLGLFTHLSNQRYTMRKIVVSYKTTFESWKYNPVTEKFEKQEVK